VRNLAISESRNNDFKERRIGTYIEHFLDCQAIDGFLLEQQRSPFNSHIFGIACPTLQSAEVQKGGDGNGAPRASSPAIQH
jgi:hypothetical protein